MKKKWLIAIATSAMAVTVALGISACGKKNGKSDEDIATEALDTLTQVYSTALTETSADFDLLGQVLVDGERYTVTWTATSTVEGIENYVSIAQEMNEDKKFHVTISRTTIEVPYTLTASITVGKVTKSENFLRKIPAKSSEDATTASLSFETTDARVSQDAQQQVWQQNGITFTNDKANSSTDVANFSKPVRCYMGSTVKIEYPGITRIDFHCPPNYDDNPYLDRLNSALTNAYGDATVTVDEEKNVVSIVLKTPVDVFEFACTTGQIRIYSIDLEGKEGGATDADKVAAAKEQLSLSRDRYSATGTYDLPTTLNGATLTWSVKGTSEYLTISNNKLNITSLPTAETQVTLVAAISAGTESDSKEITITVAPASKFEGSGTEDDPYTVADVFEILKDIQSGDLYKVDGNVVGIYVKGIVIDKGSIGSHDNWERAYIADSADAENKDGVQLYGLDKDDQFLPNDDSLVVGATITVYGALQNWQGGPELKFDGSIRLHAVAYELPTDERTAQQKVDAALQALAATFTVTKTGETELPASTVTGVTFAWSTTNQTYTITGNKIKVDALPTADATVTATVTATCGTETVTNNTKTVTITIKAASEEPEPNKYGTKDEPLSVAEALALAEEECASANDVTEQIVYATGIALSTPEASGTYYKQFELRDASDAAKKIIVYTISLDAGVPAIAQNDVLVIHGYIKNYNGTIEFASNNSVYVYCVTNTRGESTITLGEHTGATVTGIQTGDKKTNGTEVSFTVTAEQGKKIVAVKANGEELTAESENTYKFTVAGNTTVTVETAGEDEAVAELLYSLNSTEQPVGTNNNYASSCEVAYKDVTWVVEGNAKVDQHGAQKPWRFGGKASNADTPLTADRKLTGKTAISGKVSKITLQLTDGGSITVNSVTIKVYKTDPTVDGAQPFSTKQITYQKGVAVDITAGEDDWTNCFFQIVFNVTVNSTSNKYVSIDKLEFYGTPASATVAAPAEVAILPGKEF